MPRKARNDIGDKTYHILNRINKKEKLFQTYAQYELFETILFKATERFSVKLFSYNIMPNHFHLVVYSEKANEISKFMHWICTTFTRHWHVRHHSTGNGHLFQGRYKSFIIEEDSHLLQVLLYVERNALTAGLVQKAEEWRWCSAWIRLHGTESQKKALSPWPIDPPENYLDSLNKK